MKWPLLMTETNNLLRSTNYQTWSNSFKSLRFNSLCNPKPIISYFFKDVVVVVTDVMYSSTRSFWVIRHFLTSSFSIVSWTLSIHTFVGISASNQRQSVLLKAVPELLNRRLVKLRTSKSQFRTKFVLNGNQDWCLSVVIDHVKSLIIGFPKHVGLGFTRSWVGVYLLWLPGFRHAFSL